MHGKDSKDKPSSGHLWTLIKNLEYNTIEIWKLARSWSTFEILKFCLKHYLRMPGGSSLVISIMLLNWTTELFQVNICGTNKVIIKRKMGLFWLSEDLKIWEYNLEGLTAHSHSKNIFYSVILLILNGEIKNNVI